MNCSPSADVPARDFVRRMLAVRALERLLAQVEAVFTALPTARRPVTAKDLAATFARGDAKAVAEILSALVTLGRIHRGQQRGAFVS